jgi:hypothetical protein
VRHGDRPHSAAHLARRLGNMHAVSGSEVGLVAITLLLYDQLGCWHTLADTSG